MLIFANWILMSMIDLDSELVDIKDEKAKSLTVIKKNTNRNFFSDMSRKFPLISKFVKRNPVIFGASLLYDVIRYTKSSHSFHHSLDESEVITVSKIAPRSANVKIEKSSDFSQDFMTFVASNKEMLEHLSSVIIDSSNNIGYNIASSLSQVSKEIADFSNLFRDSVENYMLIEKIAHSKTY